jgi:hypothetical protein
MAITPNNYPFSGGAFMGGDSSYVTRGDIHTLNVTKNGESVGNYNPIVGDANIDIPSDASNDTSTFTKASDDRSTMTSGSKLSVLFTAISSFFASIFSALGGKADKVQGATAGNLAALDANGNLTDSDTKPTDFKTKQTAVEDPTAEGTGLSFIDYITQNANGEITPRKKTVQDGTTAQKGMVQLQDSVGSTESATDKAVTPHAVRVAINSAVSSAYHAAGTKTVAQLTGSLLIAENEGCVYNVTDSGTTTSDFVDGAGHPINAGDNVGVCDVGGGVYKFDLLSGFVDLSNYLTKTGDASNTTSTFTKASDDVSSMTSGSKLSAIFTAISSFFASLKALAFKDTVGTSDIADDAITADKVKDNETLPVNISGMAIPSRTSPLKGWVRLASFDFSNIGANLYYGRGIVFELFGSSYQQDRSYLGKFELSIANYGNFSSRIPTVKTLAFVDRVVSLPVYNQFKLKLVYYANYLEVYMYHDKNGDYPIGVKVISSIESYSSGIPYTLLDFTFIADADWDTFIAGKTSEDAVWANVTASNAMYASRIGRYDSHPKIGSPSTPVYVDTDGSVNPCGFQVNFGTPIAGTNVLNIVT